MDGPDGPWDKEDLKEDHRWQEIRNLAKAALKAFGWPDQQPLPRTEFFWPLGIKRE
jgi:hypothetical protein